MIQKFLCSTFTLLFSFVSFSYSQADQKETVKKSKDLGASLQLYPAGIITAINSEMYLSSKNSLLFRAGINFANRKDFSPYNENEKGMGFGGSTGYRRHFYVKRGNIVAGIHTDIWNMWINWKNNIGESDYTYGETYTLVLQPWLEAGYFFSVKKSPLQLGFTTGFGREINIITNGKEVGQGWMNSLLIQIQYSLKSKK